MIEVIKDLIEKEISKAEVDVGGDGSKFTVTVVSDVFENKSAVNSNDKLFTLIEGCSRRYNIKLIISLQF